MLYKGNQVYLRPKVSKIRVAQKGILWTTCRPIIAYFWGVNSLDLHGYYDFIPWSLGMLWNLIFCTCMFVCLNIPTTE